MKEGKKILGICLALAVGMSSLFTSAIFADTDYVSGERNISEETQVTTVIPTDKKTTQTTTKAQEKITERITEKSKEIETEPTTKKYEETTVKETETERKTETEIQTVAPRTVTTEVQTETTTQALTETVSQPTTNEVKTELTTVIVTETTTETTTHSHDIKATIREYDVNIRSGYTLSLPDKYFYSGHTANQFKWDSSDSTIVTIDNSGSMYAKREGSATITAYSENYIYIFHVSVNSDKTDSERTLTLYNGNDCDLSKYVQFSSKYYTWKSSNTSRARVDNYGAVTTRAAGYVEITAVYDNYNGYAGDVRKYTFKINIKDKATSSTSGGRGVVTKYYDRKFTIFVPTGSSVDLSEFLSKAPTSYSWTSVNSNIASVSKTSGKVFGSRAGSTTVYAEGSSSYAFTIRVSDKYTSVVKKMEVGETLDIEKYLKYDLSAYNISVYDNHEIKYSKGVVSAVGTGTSYVLCDGNKESVQIIVNVENNNTTTVKTETTTEATTYTKAESNYTANTAFNDISGRAWAVSSIEKMAGKGFIVGRGQGIFAPDENCSRADFAIVLVKMLGLDGEIADNSNYSDIDKGAYFEKYVGIAKKYNLSAGVTGGRYFPKNNITREEIMAMVYNALSYKGVEMNTDTSILNSYTDADNIDSDYKKAVAGLLSIKAVKGTSDTTIDPKASITRAQMAVLMNNFYGKIS